MILIKLRPEFCSQIHRCVCGTAVSLCPDPVGFGAHRRERTPRTDTVDSNHRRRRPRRIVEIQRHPVGETRRRAFPGSIWHENVVGYGGNEPGGTDLIEGLDGNCLGTGRQGKYFRLVPVWNIWWNRLLNSINVHSDQTVVSCDEQILDSCTGKTVRRENELKFKLLQYIVMDSDSLWCANTVMNQWHVLLLIFICHINMQLNIW